MFSSFLSPNDIMDGLSSYSTVSPFSSLLTSFDESIPAYLADEAFNDQVSLSDLTSDPSVQTAFVVAAIAVVILVVSKAIVTQMDEAVERVAIDFDRVMKLKYPKKWEKFMGEADDSSVGGTARDGGKTKEEVYADRVQRIVEEMERFSNEEPEFMARIMKDVERM